MDRESDHRRDPVAGPDRVTVAGRARGLPAVEELVSMVSTLGRDGVWAQILAALQAQADAAGLIGLDRECGLDHQPCPSACGRRPP